MREPVEIPPVPEPDPHRDPIALALVAELGAHDRTSASVEGIVRRAGITRSEFDRRYSGLDDCLVDAYERFIDDFERKVGQAFNAHEDWRASLRAAAYATADWMEASPDLVDFGTVGVLVAGGETARIRREELAAFCAALIERGRRAAPDPDQVPESAPLMAIGAIFNLLTQRVQEGEVVDPAGMVPEMMYVTVRIYLGEEAAREELSLPRPASPDPRR